MVDASNTNGGGAARSSPVAAASPGGDARAGLGRCGFHLGLERLRGEGRGGHGASSDDMTWLLGRSNLELPGALKPNGSDTAQRTGR